MSRLDLRTPSTIDQTKTRHGTSIRVRRSYIVHEGPLAERSQYGHFNNRSFKRNVWFCPTWRRDRFGFGALGEDRSEASFQYPIKLGVGNKSHGSSKRALVRGAIGFLQSTFVVFTTFGERHWQIKIKVVGHLREVMIGKLRVLDDRRDARNAKVTLSSAYAG